MICTMFRARHHPNFALCPHSTLTTSLRLYRGLGRCGLNGWPSRRLDGQLWRAEEPSRAIVLLASQGRKFALADGRSVSLLVTLSLVRALNMKFKALRVDLVPYIIV
jgi:hypothetical protein